MKKLSGQAWEEKRTQKRLRSKCLLCPNPYWQSMFFLEKVPYTSGGNQIGDHFVQLDRHKSMGSNAEASQRWHSEDVLC